MFEIAFAIGIFSYSVYFLGLLGLLFSPLLIVFTLLFWIGFFVWQKNTIASLFSKLSLRHEHPLIILSIGYITLQAIVNAIGLFGPEISFDATWYHLTLPKLYLLYHTIPHIPGGILYYSDMPRLTEMLYTAGFAFGSDFFARSIHFLFGIATCFVVYKIGRKFFSPVWAILLPVIFYSNLVVGWESFSGYIDLARTFFTTLAFLAFLEWREGNNLPAGRQGNKYFFYSAFLVGLTISTKLLSLWDIPVYCFVLLFLERNTLSLAKRLKRISIFLLCIFICLLPWMTFSFIHTGNPVFPLFTSYYVGGYFTSIVNPLFFLSSIWSTFGEASDPIHPLFLATLPFIILNAKKLWRQFPVVVLFAIGEFFSWYLTPQTGGGRYILPYLPLFSLVGLLVIHQLSKKWQQIFVVFIFAVAGISLVYRIEANAKFLPVILHKETRAHFITTHLQYSLGDFYDTDGWFGRHIRPTDTVLLYGFHNLYYVDFPFISGDWVKPGDKFTYVAVQGKGMPDRFKYWNLVYFNPTTQVRVYSLFGKAWYY